MVHIWATHMPILALGLVGDLEVRLGQYKISNGFVEGEEVQAVAQCQRKEGAGEVEAVSRRHKVVALLEIVVEALSLLFGALVRYRIRSPCTPCLTCTPCCVGRY